MALSLSIPSGRWHHCHHSRTGRTTSTDHGTRHATDADQGPAITAENGPYDNFREDIIRDHIINLIFSAHYTEKKLAPCA